MTKFDLILEERGMDCRAKLLELSNWRTGPPKLLVDAKSVNNDPVKAYEKARKELDMLLGRNYNSTVGLMAIIKNGKALKQNHRRVHVAFYAEL